MLKRARFTTALLLSVVLLSALLASAFSASAHENTVTFGLNATDGKVGDTITLNLTLSPDSYFTNCMLYLDYDTEAVEYVEGDLGDIAPRKSLYADNDFSDLGYVKAAFVTTDGITSGGTLLTFQFRVLKEQPAVFSLRMDECCGVEADGTEFNVNYSLGSCLINDDGSGVQVATTAVSAAATPADATTVKTVATVAPPTSIVTVPVTVTDAQGQAVTDTDGTVQTTFITGSVTVTTTTSEDDPLPEEEEPDGSGGSHSAALYIVGIVAALLALAIAGGVFFMSRKARSIRETPASVLPEGALEQPEQQETAEVAEVAEETAQTLEQTDHSDQ